MESIDKKIQEAVEEINAHGERIRNMFKNDPINYNVDDNWKFNLSVSDILVQEKNGEHLKKNEQAQKNEVSTIKSVPLKNSSENEGSKKVNQTLRISNLNKASDSEYSFKANFIEGQSYIIEQSYYGKIVHNVKITELRRYIRLFKFCSLKNKICFFSGYGHAEFRFIKTNKPWGGFMLIQFKDLNSASRLMKNKNNLIIDGCKFHVSEAKVTSCR